MSNIDPSISNSEVIPTINTEIFKDFPESRFAVGRIGTGMQAREGLDDIAAGYYSLRGRVYIDQTRMLTEEQRLRGGGEMDLDDLRSVHFAVVENLGNRQRVVASMRIIYGGQYGRLPIEELFDDLDFSGVDNSKSIEISRYICRHEDPLVQAKLKWLLYQSVLAYIMKNNLGPTYGVVEEPVESRMLKDGVPIRRIASPVYIEEYNGNNMPIVINTTGLALAMESRTPGSISTIDPDMFVYSDKIVDSHGLVA